jgi:hypothetical protein
LVRENREVEDEIALSVELVENVIDWEIVIKVEIRESLKPNRILFSYKSII